ncbi:MAG: hypothetical protein CFE29_03035 [Bradyrhizobiaceae bacterium PARB1]|jgi:hypothetical protein|nr:MAG: hypothetical protein CFE29_03035 [Bradyrhizobiaceae bacterium PARB1]
MSPTVTRSELNNANDIIRETGVRPMRRAPLEKPYLTAELTSGCTGKTAFVSRRAAELKMHRGCVAYRCKYCRQWHIGNKG